MAKLTQEESDFLSQHDIHISRVFDATGLRTKDWKQRMKDLGKMIAVGTSPCDGGGHTMRTKYGHCAICNPAALAFLRRYSETAYVYVAGSKSLRRVKVGFASDIERRMMTLNQLGYGDSSDWECIYWTHTEGAGRKEHEAQLALSVYASPTSYLRDGTWVDCLEVFACDGATAVAALQNAVSKPLKTWTNHKIASFDFENITGGQFIRRGPQ